MNAVEDDIVKARELLYKKIGNGKVFNKYSSSFLFTTENQEGINSVLPYKGKDVCTVASSGDQYLGAVYYGAKNVDIYDINRFTYYITYLKIGAIRALDYEEFIDFFVPVRIEALEEKFWNLKTLKKVLPYLPGDVAYFWENMMYELRKYRYGNFISPTSLYNHLIYATRGMPFYDKKSEYIKLQELLKLRDFPKFYETDLFEMSKNIPSNYDIVYLSNIIECMVRSQLDRISMIMYGIGNEDAIEMDVIDNVVSEFMPILRETGTVLVSYRMTSSILLSRDWLYSNDFFDVSAIPSKILPYDESGFEEPDTDLVLTYTPSKSGLLFK